MFAVTIVGTTARLWVCYPDDQYLSPLSFEESVGLSDRNAYLEANSIDGAILREQFALLKQQAEGLNARTLPQPPTLPSQRQRSRDQGSLITERPKSFHYPSMSNTSFPSMQM